MFSLVGFVLLLNSLVNGQPGQECGRKIENRPWDGARGRIVGGRDSYPEHFWPWQLSLQILRENTTTYGHTCGASLVDRYWAITAAHCVTARMVGLDDPRREDPANFRLIAGANDLSNLNEDGVQILFIDLIIKHERWFPNPYLGYPNDIAMLRLSEPADLSDNVELACIPKLSEMNFTHEDCWITGWGLMDWRDDTIPAILQEAQVEQISLEVCKEANFGYIRESHICAGTGYPNACSGDSGGPMSCLKDGVWYLAGSTSWGAATCSLIPGVYTRTSSFWEWTQVVMYFLSPP